MNVQPVRKKKMTTEIDHPLFRQITLKAEQVKKGDLLYNLHFKAYFEITTVRIVEDKVNIHLPLTNVWCSQEFNVGEEVIVFQPVRIFQ